MKKFVREHKLNSAERLLLLLTGAAARNAWYLWRSAGQKQLPFFWSKRAAAITAKQAHLYEIGFGRRTEGMLDAQRYLSTTHFFYRQGYSIGFGYARCGGRERALNIGPAYKDLFYLIVMEVPALATSFRRSCSKPPCSGTIWCLQGTWPRGLRKYARVPNLK